MTDIAGKTAFITGGANGIGLGIAKALAARGANLMLIDLNEAALAEVKARFAGTNVRVETAVCDVAKADAVRVAADKAIEAFGKVHIVVNNAGVALGGLPGEIALEDWRWIVDINLMGVVYGVESLLPHIRSHGEGGHIVNVASMAGHIAMPGMGPYHATKFAVVGYSEALRAELAGDHIGVSALCPGWVKTSIHKSVAGRPSGGVDLEAPENAAMNEVIENGLSPNTVGEWTADCIEANRGYIFTHEEMAPALDMRYQMVKADYDAAIANPALKK